MKSNAQLQLLSLLNEYLEDPNCPVEMWIRDENVPLVMKGCFVTIVKQLRKVKNIVELSEKFHPTEIASAELEAKKVLGLEPRQFKRAWA